MQVWNNKTRTPLNGWRYKVPETGTLIHGSSFNVLVNKVQKHMDANEIAYDLSLQRRIEEFMCAEIPDGCSEVYESEPKPRSLNVGDVLRFTALIGADIINGRERVSKEESNRRAEICAGCVDNIKPEGCTRCNERRIAKVVEVMAGARATQYDAKLESCRHCGCLNRAQVWFPLGLLRRFMREDVNEALPSHCWKKK